MALPRIDSRSRHELVKILQSTRALKARDAGYDEIEDLVQDTLIRAMGREGTTAAFDAKRSSWTTWIVRVADDCMRTSWRRQSARQKLNTVAVDREGQATPSDWRRRAGRRAQMESAS